MPYVIIKINSMNEDTWIAHQQVVKYHLPYATTTCIPPNRDYRTQSQQEGPRPSLVINRPGPQSGVSHSKSFQRKGKIEKGLSMRDRSPNKVRGWESSYFGLTCVY